MMNKYILSISAVLLFAGVANARDRHGLDCDETGCRVRPASAVRLDDPFSVRLRDRCCQNSETCRDGECCVDGQCRSLDRSDCPDGFCEPDATAQHRFPYMSERSAADRRLADPFRPTDRDIRREDVRFVPTRYRSPRLSAGDVQWETDLREAAALARNTRRPLLVQVSAEWCTHCERMKADTYTDTRIRRLLSENFIPVAVDADDQREFMQQMGIRSLPTTLIVAPDLKILERLQGFQSANSLLSAVSR